MSTVGDVGVGGANTVRLVNGGNDVDKAAFRAYLEKQGFSAAEIDALVAKNFPDGKISLTFAEFKTILDSLVAGGKPSTSIFDNITGDTVDKTVFTEYLKKLGFSEAEIKQIADKIFTDANTVLTKDEFVKLLDSLVKKGNPPVHQNQAN